MPPLPRSGHLPLIAALPPGRELPRAENDVAEHTTQQETHALDRFAELGSQLLILWVLELGAELHQLLGHFVRVISAAPLGPCALATTPKAK
jgi:hypothetical protein